MSDKMLKMFEVRAKEKVEKLKKTFESINSEVNESNENNVLDSKYKTFLISEIRGEKKKLIAYKVIDGEVVINEDPAIIICEKCMKDFGISIGKNGIFKIHCPFCNDLIFVHNEI